MLKPSNEQTLIIRHGTGHALVAAVPGAGKTVTLVERFLYLAFSGVPVERILVLMYNAAVQKNFVERLQGRILGHPKIYTFHAFSMRITNTLMEMRVLPRAILRSEEWFWINLAKHALAETDARPVQEVENEEAEKFLACVELWKGELLSPDEIEGEEGQGRDKQREAYRIFERERAAHGARAFTDLIYDAMRAIRNNPSLAACFANKMDHIIVDEFQDTNRAQFELLKMLAGERAQVMAVGDDDQAIYAWRGARPDFMLHEFDQAFPNPARYVLSQTFRFGPSLATVSNQMIRSNNERIEKPCRTAHAMPYTTVYAHVTAYQESEMVRWIANIGEYGETAVLVRKYHQTAPVEIAMTLAGIPYRLEGAAPFHLRREVLSLLGYLEFGLDPESIGKRSPDARAHIVEAMLRIPSRFLGKEIIEEAKHAVRCGKTLHEWLQMVAHRLDMKRRSGDRKAAGQARQLQDMLATLAMVDSLARLGTETHRLLRRLIATLELEEHFFRQSGKEAAADSLLLCHGLCAYAERGGLNPTEFLEHMADLALRHGVAAGPSVLITSIHRAKGLEWDHVFLPDLRQGIYPFLDAEEPRARFGLRTSAPSTPMVRPSTDEAVTEKRWMEERRLCYVAMTRAIRTLHLLMPDDPATVSLLTENLDRKRKDLEQTATCSPFMLEFDPSLLTVYRNGCLLKRPEVSMLSSNNAGLLAN